MKRLMKPAAAIAVAAALAGCGKGPGDVAMDLQKDLCQTGSFSALYKHITPESKQMVDLMVSAFESEPKKARAMKAELTKNCPKDPARPFKVLEDGDWAQVWMTPNDEKPLTLRKVDGHWKVHVTK